MLVGNPSGNNYLLHTPSSIQEKPKEEPSNKTPLELNLEPVKEFREKAFAEAGTTKGLDIYA